MKLLRTILILLLFTLSDSCFSQLVGTYSHNGQDYKYHLTLSADFTFDLNKVYFEVDAKCKGTWRKISGNIILLKCLEGTLSEKLSGGYINERGIQLKLVSRNKLKLNNVIMKRE